MGLFCILVFVYTGCAIVHYIVVTAAISLLFKTIPESSGGYGFQESGDCFEIKKLFSWCDMLEDF